MVVLNNNLVHGFKLNGAISMKWFNRRAKNPNEKNEN
jgi:hypothetical protein